VRVRNELELIAVGRLAMISCLRCGSHEARLVRPCV